MEVFEAWGYARVITPVFECADVLERGLGARCARGGDPVRRAGHRRGRRAAARHHAADRAPRRDAHGRRAGADPALLRGRGHAARRARPASARSCRRASSSSMRREPRCATPRCSRSRRRRSRALGLPETRLDVGHVAPARVRARRCARSEARVQLAAALARKDRAGCASRRARCPTASRRSPRRSSTLWGPAQPTLDARARAAVARGVRAALDAATRGARGVRASSPSSRRRRHGRSRRSARLRLLHRHAVRRRTPAAHPMRCCAAAATTS